MQKSFANNRNVKFYVPYESSSQNSHETVTSGSFLHYKLSFLFWTHHLGYISTHFLYKYSCRLHNFCPINYWRKMWHILHGDVRAMPGWSSLRRCFCFKRFPYPLSLSCISRFTKCGKCDFFFISLLLNTRESVRSISLMTSWIEF